MTVLLYIEDDESHRELATRMLTARGFTVETAEDGVEGVESALRLTPDLILLDLMLPHMDGFGVMRGLKENASTRNIPVLVISAWPTDDNRRRVREAGARGFVTKPFKADDLANLIRHILAGAAEESAEASHIDSGPLSLPQA
jgi:DNA-binding response OmpR family regulator